MGMTKELPLVTPWGDSGNNVNDSTLISSKFIHDRKKTFRFDLRQQRRLISYNSRTRLSFTKVVQ